VAVPFPGSARRCGVTLATTAKILDAALKLCGRLQNPVNGPVKARR